MRAARSFTVAALFDQAFARFADRVAVTSENGSWTYAEVGDRSRRLAVGLQALSLSRGDRVAVLSPPRPEYVECYAAMARLGITVLTLNTRLHVEELAWCIESGRPDAVFAAGEFGDRIAQLRRLCPGVRDWVCLDGVTTDTVPYSALINNDGALSAEYPQPEDIHNVLYTSGTTGRPKGAMISQSAAATRGLRVAQWFSLTPDDGFVGWLPMFHCAGDESLYGTFLTGGRYATFAKTDVEQMYARIESERLSWTLLLPGVITNFLDNPARADHDLSSLRFAIGYANMMPHVIERLTRECSLDFYDAFGQTETSYLLAHGVSHPGETPSLRKHACPLTEIALVDSTMRPVEPGTPGECVVRGPSLMSGYLDNSEATGEAFDGGWLHTGDVLVENPDRTYSFVDRTKYLIKSGGENIYPAEIEQVLTEHPAVREACAFGVPDPRWGETVKVVVVPLEGAQVSPSELVQWCRQRLAGYKTPRYVQLVAAEDLPRSTTGKVQRHVLVKAPLLESEML
ncbi:long-chain fatty acid--CoA ligase [Rhodococcus sp. WS4]|nr:long-chain fatty acid--CoA ligase [Rhodococcus sp. WS4]